MSKCLGVSVNHPIFKLCLEGSIISHFFYLVTHQLILVDTRRYIIYLPYRTLIVPKRPKLCIIARYPVRVFQKKIFYVRRSRCRHVDTRVEYK